ncbi:MAG: Nif3-like dinuclear metal center hexameric protein [Synergistales bacterium]|nr:Nif3-like dinuclear metal center hexameric protein [Synergistales bacterium]
MKIRDFLSTMESRIPLDWAEEWDNCGLMAGDRNWEVEKVALALDATEEAVMKAYEEGCQLLVVHHPLIYQSLSNLDLQNNVPRTLFSALSRNMGIVSYHTNWDKSPEGVNVSLARKIGLSEMIPLIPSADGVSGMGVLGELPEMGLTLQDLARIAKSEWDLDWVRFYGADQAYTKKVAICGGSGGDLWQRAFDMEADTFITADMKYHQIMAALEREMKIICVDHGEMEWVSIPDLGVIISEHTGLETRVLNRRKDLARIPGFIL